MRYYYSNEASDYYATTVTDGRKLCIELLNWDLLSLDFDLHLLNELYDTLHNHILRKHKFEPKETAFFMAQIEKG